VFDALMILMLLESRLGAQAGGSPRVQRTEL
jgi:hypothetical protein